MPVSTHVEVRKVPLARVLISLAACTVLFTVVVYGLAKQEAESDLAALISSEATKVELSAIRMEHAFIFVSNNLRTQAKTPAVTAFGSNRSVPNKKALARFLTSLLIDKPIFQQARFIGTNGYELVRAERTEEDIIITPDSELQYKGDRYYVKQSLDLAEEEIFVSALDLDLENGAVVVPFRPVMRFATGVFDEHGQRLGIFVLNMRGQSLLDILAGTKTYSHAAFLINNAGHVLSGPDNTQQWGFMFGLPAEFKSLYPLAWQVISRERRGHTLNDSGLFVFETVNPLTYIQLRPWDPEESQELVHDAYWKAVSFIPANELPSMVIFFKSTTIIAYLTGLAVLLSALLTLLILNHKRRILRRQMDCQALRFRRIANALGEGLLVINRSAVITFVNPEAAHILGWNADELIMRNCREVFSMDLNQHERCPILSVLDSGEAVRNHRHIFRRKDGQGISVDLNAAPLSGDMDAEGIVVSFRDCSTIQQYQEEIHKLTFHDAVTGLPNRKVLEDRLTQALSFAERYNHSIALLFLGLDHFKQVNDAYGHTAGDALLKEVAGRLNNCVRDTDTVVRMGGDEFIILLPELQHAEDAQIIAKKILTALSYPLLIHNQDMGIGASIGIAVTKGEKITTEQLLKKADNAMYQAKHAGRNNSVTAANFSVLTEPGAH